MTRFAAVMMLAGFLVLTLLGVASAQGRSESKVKVQAKSGKAGADGKQEITLTIDIEKGWHIYANPVGNPSLEPAETSLNITSKTKLDKVEVVYPEGKVKRDAAVGAHKIYEGQIVITARVHRADGDTGPLDLRLKVNACDQNSCLPAGTVKLTVP